MDINEIQRLVRQGKYELSIHAWQERLDVTEWENADGKYAVTAIGETVTVPAGTFPNCVEVTHWSASDTVTTITLYAPGVGVVQRDETFPIVGSGIGSFDASQLGSGIGGFDASQRGHAVLRLKEWKAMGP